MGPVFPITDGKDPPFLMGKSTISMVIFHSYVELPAAVVQVSSDLLLAIAQLLQVL